MTFDKPALTVTRKQLADIGVDLGTTQQLLPILPVFWSLVTTISDRATCETDPSLQQVLPYVTLLNEKGQVFVYGRGAKGGEQRLVGKLSLGLGGHVDTEPPIGSTLYAHLCDEARRELKEEASLTRELPLRLRKFISDQTPDGNEVPVGSVHLGIWFTTEITNADLGTLEDGVIVNGEWMDFPTLVANLDRFESWSQIIIRDHQAAGYFGL